MLSILRKALNSRGLSLHPAKGQAQTSREYFKRGQVVIEESVPIEVIPVGECLDLLGTKLCLQDPTGSEITHRIAKGWSKFFGFEDSADEAEILFEETFADF